MLAKVQTQGELTYAEQMLQRISLLILTAIPWCVMQLDEYLKSKVRYHLGFNSGAQSLLVTVVV